MAGVGFRFVAEPPGAQGLAGFLHQASDPAAPLVVAADQPQRAVQQLRQGVQLGPQLGGEPQSAVDQVAQHDHLLGPQPGRQLQQGVEGGGVAIGG